MAKTVTSNDIIAEIAKTHLRIDTLEVRNSDSLDFHEVGVATLKDALEAAYLAGIQYGRDLERLRVMSIR